MDVGRRRGRRIASALVAVGRWIGPNITVQPANRGTANGILLPLLSILAQDPFAKVVFLPSDHYFADEAIIARSLHRAVEQVYARPNSLALLGIQPDEADAFRVTQFVEKPPVEIASSLISRGAVWNSFIFAADGNALLSVYRQIMPEIVDEMETARARDATRGSHPGALAELYDRLPGVDFSSRIAQSAEEWLTLLPVPRCGWSDLGTPKRVAETLMRSPGAGSVWSKRPNASAYFSLAASHATLPIAGWVQKENLQ